MQERLFEELKRYVGFDAGDERALRGLHPLAVGDLPRIAAEFYRRILDHEEARKALVGAESSVGRLKTTLVSWMDLLLTGPWDEEYFERRCRIGRVHVKIALPQHYMFGAMNVVRTELQSLAEARLSGDPERKAAVLRALGRILDLELAIMLHTYREDLVSQAERNERLSTFGQLAGSIGHELRNPLAVIETSLFILRSRLEEDDRIRKHVDRIGEQLGIANDIVSALLDIIRDRPLSRERHALGALVANAASSVPRPAGVRLELEGLEGLPELDGDPAQLRQVFVNLVENAVHAASPEGLVRLSGRTADGAVELVVADTGPGVDETVLRRLFEPLITTKVKGIGLGLPLVRRIVERHGGTVAYRRPPERGAHFIVRLPLG